MGKVTESKPHKDSKGSLLRRMIGDTRYKIPREEILEIRITGNLFTNQVPLLTLYLMAKERKAKGLLK